MLTSFLPILNSDDDDDDDRQDDTLNDTTDTLNATGETYEDCKTIYYLFLSNNLS